jgi:hypothetical protein
LSIESTCSENAVATAASGFTNAGAITLTNREGCKDNARLTVSSGTLTNSGTITSDESALSERVIQGNLTNTGMLAINTNTAYNASGATLKNSGTVTVSGAGVVLSATNGATISNEAGGTIAGPEFGRLLQPGGTFNQGLGKTTGVEPARS